jgi:hypothetical protein
MVKEELYIGGYVVELLESLNPNLTFNIADISKPDTRNADYSKTINLPASKRINQIFEHIFELSSDLQTFNPNLRTEVIYLVDGEVQIDGYLQLKSINNKDGDISYSCIIIGRVGNFIADLQDAELTDLDLSSLNHIYNKTNQAATWNLPLTTDYVYPMINYNTNYGVITSGLENWSVGTFYPAVKAKKYLDLIFESIGYTYTSTFLDNSFFNTLIIPFSSSEFKLTETDLLDRLFEANTPELVTSGLTTFPVPRNDYSKISTDFSSAFVNFTNEVNDPSNVFDNTNGVYEVSATGAGFYNLEAMLQLQGSFATTATNSQLPVDQNGNSYLWQCKTALVGYIKINRYDANNVFIDTLDSINYGIASNPFNNFNGVPVTLTSNPSPVTYTQENFYHTAHANGYINDRTYNTNNGQNNRNSICSQYFVTANNVFLNAGEKIKIELIYTAGLFNRNNQFQNASNSNTGEWESDARPPTNPQRVYMSIGTSYNLTIVGGYFKNTVVNSNITEGNTIPMNLCIPKNIKQKDFIMSLVKMFNLYIQPDSNDSKNLLIEPRDDFYSNVVTNWSSKLDKSQDIESKPMGALNFKEYLYTYKQDKDYYNELYFDTWEEVYGQDDFILANQFLKNKHKTEIIFSPTPSVGQDWYDRVLPTIIKYDDSNELQRTESNIRILQWGGMKATGQQWIHTNLAANQTFFNTYPYAGMYDDPYTPTEILEFGLTNEIYYANGFNKVITFTNNGLFNKYYSKFLQEITDNNSKIVTAYFYLNPSDIKNLSFKNQYYFEGQYFRLSKVENYNPINPLTKCEFLKIKLADVFQAGTTIGNGGATSKIANDNVPLFSNGNSLLRNNNSLGNLGQKIIGENNYISRRAKGVNIIGNSNRVNTNASNIEISGNNNNVLAGCENVRLINTDNQIVTSSNITYINNEINAGNGSTVTVTDADIVASLNVQNYFCKTDGEDNITITFSTTESITIGKIWLFKKLGSENRVIIDSSSIGTTIDGEETYDLTANNKYVSIQWNGTEFLIISNN